MRGRERYQFREGVPKQRKPNKIKEGVKRGQKKNEGETMRVKSGVKLRRRLKF